MRVLDTFLSDVKIIEPKTYKDNRGLFFESFNHKLFEKMIGIKINFVQDNHSYSKKGVIRGLHYQNSPHSQGKLIRVIKGEIFDVAVDIRKNSSSFGLWVGEILTAKNKKQMWIPEGFAHGFQVLSNSAEILYKTTKYYSPKLERVIYYEDKDLNINWKKNLNKILSDKDKNGESFKSL